MTEYEYHTYQPFHSQLDNNDEIRIAIQELDAYTLHSQCTLYIEGHLTKEDGTAIDKLRFISNEFSFLFREIQYEMIGVVLDSGRNVSLTSTLKGCISHNESESLNLQNAGWYPIYFTSWELVKFSSMHENTTHTWPVRTTTNLQTPQKIIIAFQTDKKTEKIFNV